MLSGAAIPLGTRRWLGGVSKVQGWRWSEEFFTLNVMSHEVKLDAHSAPH
jgi:hypothetical protein